MAGWALRNMPEALSVISTRPLNASPGLLNSDSPGKFACKCTRTQAALAQGTMADKQPLVYPHMPPPERAAFCARAPWWTAPVIVGGSGGSGTRGSVLLLQRLGVGMACEDAIFDTSLFDPTTHCNRAKDFDLMGGRRQRMPQLVWFTASQNRSEPHQPSCSVNGGEVAHLPPHRACACACTCAYV